MAEVEVVTRRREIALAIAQFEGNLLRTAHFMGIHRSHMYRLVNKYELWGVVNAARIERAEREREERKWATGILS